MSISRAGSGLLGYLAAGLGKGARIRAQGPVVHDARRAWPQP
jgi:hypothetical protein